MKPFLLLLASRQIIQKWFAFLVWGLCATLSGQAQSNQPLPIAPPIPAGVTSQQNQMNTGSARALAAIIRYVKEGATGDGSSWSQASGNLQAMINASASGDQVWIAGGTYKPNTTGLSNPRNAAFSLKNNVSVLGGFTGTNGTEGDASARSVMPSSTTLSGDIDNDGSLTGNCYHVVYNNSGQNNSAVLDGVVVTGGNDANGFGGGIYNNTSACSIINCQISQNFADTGGGMVIAASNGTRVINCSFQNNGANAVAGLYDALTTNTRVSNCHFEQNSANQDGGIAINQTPNITLVNCTFRRNRPSAISIFSTTCSLVNCLLWDNGGQGTIGGINYTANVRYSLIQPSETTYIDGGNNQVLTRSPFANATGPQLLPCAPAIDAGDDAANSITTDILGNDRTARTIDIGAVEFDGSPYTVAVTALSTPNSICINNSTRLQAMASNSLNTPYSYTWTAPSGASLSNANLNPASATVTTAGVASFSILVSDAIGCRATNSVSVTVNALPTANILTPASTTITCSTPSLSLTATGGGTYRWDNNSTNAVRSVTSSGTYSVTVTNANGCTAVDSQIISIDNTPPNANILVPASATLTCNTTALSLTATGGGTYRWNNNTTSAVRSVTASGTYSVTVTAPNGCTAVDSQVITSNTTAPTANILAPASATLTCTTTALNLTATGGGTYRWDNNTASAIRSVTTGGTYSVTVTAPNGCTAVDSQVITSKTSSLTANIPTSTTAREGTPFSQTFSASGGVLPYSFTVASGTLPDGLSLDPATGVLSGTPTERGGFLLTVRATDVNGCSGISPTYTLLVNKTLLPIDGFAAIPSTVCVGSPVTFTATVPVRLSSVSRNLIYVVTNGTDQINGSVRLASGSSTINVDVEVSLTPTILGPQTFTMTADYQFGDSPIGPATTSLTVNAPASATIAYAGSPFSTTSAPVNVTRTGTAGGTFTASPSGLSINASTGQITPASSTPGNYTVTYTVAASGGCPVFSTTATLTIQAAPSTDLRINLVAAGPAAVPGDQILYITGIYATDAENVILTNVLPTSVTFISSTLSSAIGPPVAHSAMVTGNIVQLTIPNLPSGRYAFGVQIRIDPASTGTLTTTSSITASTADRNPSDNTTELSLTLTPQADLSVTLTDAQTAVQAGSPVTYTLVVANSGLSNAPNATVINNLPASLTGVSWTASGTGGATTAQVSGYGNLNQTLNLPVGGSVRFVITGTLSASATGSLTNTVSVTSAAGVSDPDETNNSVTNTATIIPLTLPSISGFSALSNNVCAGSPVSFTASVGNVTGSYAYTLSNGTSTTTGSSSSTSFSQSLTPAGSGLQSFTLTLVNNALSASATTDVTLSTPSSATIAYAGSPFSTTSAPVNVTRTGTAGGTFTASPSGLSINASTGQITPASSTTGNYMVTYTVAAIGGCDQFTTTATLTIVAPPANRMPIAVNDTITLFANTAASGNILTNDRDPDGQPLDAVLVTGAARGSITLNRNGNILYTPDLNFTGLDSLSYRVCDRPANPSLTLCSNLGKVYFRVQQRQLTINGFTPDVTSICVGSPVTFTAAIGNVTPAYNFTLTNGISTTTGTSSSTTFSQRLPASGSGLQTFTLTVEASGLLTSATTNITANSLPVVTLSANLGGTLTCGQTSLTLTASEGNTYSFGGPGIVSQNATSGTAVINAGGSYSVTVTAANGCTATATTQVTQDNSAPTVTINPASATLSCTNPMVNLSATGVGTYRWSTGATSQAISVSTAGTYSVTLTSNGCVSSTTATVSSNTATVTTTAPTPFTINQGGAINIAISASGGQFPYSFSLTGGSLPDGVTIISSGLLIGTANQCGSFPYTLRATDANGCSGVASSTLAVTCPAPTISNFSADPNPVCPGSPLTFTALVGNVTGSYSYTLTNGSSTTTGSSTNLSFSQSLLAVGSGPQTFTLVLTRSGQTATATTTLSVNAIPTVSINPTSATLTSASPTVSLTAIGSGTYLWSTGETSQVISVTSSGMYSVTLTSPGGCSASTTASVPGADLTVNLVLPQAQFGASGTAAVGNLVVNVFEVGGLATSSGNVTITITAPVGYTLSFSSNLTTIDVSGGSTVAVNNTQWMEINRLEARQLTLTMNSGVFIGGGGKSSLGFSVTRTTANSGSTSSITVNVKDDLTMRYDGNLSNNVYARIISGL